MTCSCASSVGRETNNGTELRARLLSEIADRLSRWQFPAGSDALGPITLLVGELRRDAARESQRGATITPLLTSSRNALIKAMSRTRIPGPAGDLLVGAELGEWLGYLADALLASGAVRAVDELARDEVIVDLTLRHIYDHPAGPPPPRAWREYWEPKVEEHLAALAAALESQ